MPYKIAKEYKNGGQVRIYKEMDPKASDYKPIYNICNQFAKEGKVCEMTPRIHIKDARYKEVYGDLIGTKYEGKCPDFRVNGVWYELEGYKPPFNHKKVCNMIGGGLKQSSRVIIDYSDAKNDTSVESALGNRLRINAVLDELWIYEKGGVRLLK